MKPNQAPGVRPKPTPMEEEDPSCPKFNGDHLHGGEQGARAMSQNRPQGQDHENKCFLVQSARERYRCQPQPMCPACRCHGECDKCCFGEVGVITSSASLDVR